MSSLEPLEARIAPAAVVNSLPNLVAGIGKTGAVLSLDAVYDANASFHSSVTFKTNFDSDPSTPGIQGDITIELFDDVAPLTVQSFLAYAADTKNGFLNTLFHRSDATNHVLQGGGYTAAFKAIPSRGPVHTELGTAPDNTIGTVGLAHGASPNDGSGQFYFNLADNPGFDDPNSGYTVFGKLSDASLVVVQKIAALTAQNLTPGTTTAFNTVPTFNGYNPDPDNNPNTPPPLPNVNQVVKITGVAVQAPKTGAATGIHYTVENSNPALLTTQVVGGALKLMYKPGVTGEATLTVKDGNDLVVDHPFTVKVQPNLVVRDSVDNLSTLLVPGDRGLTGVTVTNAAGGVARGSVDVKVYLSQVTTADPGGNHLDDIGGGDRLLGSLTTSLNLASGASTILRPTLQVPTELVAAQGRDYRLITIVTPSAGSALTELYADDNAVLHAGVHEEYNAFGTFSANIGNQTFVRSNAPITYQDAAGHLVTMRISGGGFGLLTVDANGLNLSLGNTSGTSVVAAAVAGGAHTTLHNLQVSQSPTGTAARTAINTISFGAVDLTGEFTAFGGLKALALGNLASTDGTTHSLQLGDYSEAPGQKAAISLGNVTDYNLFSNQAISSLTVGNWGNVNATQEQIGTYFIDSFLSRGDLAADVRVGANGPVKSFTVTGSLHNAQVYIGGNVGAVRLGAMADSTFLVGTPVVPTPSALFETNRTVGSFVIKGATATTPGTFTNSVVAAANFGTLYLDSATAGNIFADAISAYQRGPVKLARLTVAGTPDVSGAYTLRIV